MKLWSGRFTKNTDARVDEFNASIRFDAVLADVDIQGSLAHVAMLGKCEILSADEVDDMTQGLQRILQKIVNHDIEFRLSDEDIHMTIERLLHEEVGPVAGKLHTGRSRNDQVALDMHLYLREQVLLILEKITALQHALIQQAHQHIDTILPGYTHLQRAQPVRFAHHLLAYVHMLQRDCERLIDSWPRINTLPLGAGALAGAGFAIDREYLAQQLGFERMYENSMDAVSDRDFVLEFLSQASLIMMHLSRFSEEIILWSSQEFQFIELDDAYCTGSSMMPQKKNPDVAELVRGKTGRVYGALMGSLTVLKGLPLAYNKDMQEDKESLFDTLKTLHDCLSLYTPMINTMRVNKEKMRQAALHGFANATELADYLVRKNVPFREAHAITGKLVQYCLENNLTLNDVTLEKYHSVHASIDNDVYPALTLEHAVDARAVRGGTAKAAVEAQLRVVQAQLENTMQWLIVRKKDSPRQT